MSALIPAHAIHVYTHDSIGLGEDGPTHQPVEHLASLRYIPGNQVWRPCDAVESAVAWKAAIERKGAPACLVFSRQNLKHQHRDARQVADISRGGYVLSDPPSAKFQVILIATGSEVELAMEAARALAQQDVAARVVSMPCTEVFDAQPLEYREGVLPGWCRARVAVEAATVDFWRKYVGLDGAVVGMTTFGASAPAAQLFEQFGITVTAVIDAAKRVTG
jgi:transketolase